jgi:hypothetical protein
VAAVAFFLFFSGSVFLVALSSSMSSPEYQWSRSLVLNAGVTGG